MTAEEPTLTDYRRDALHEVLRAEMSREQVASDRLLRARELRAFRRIRIMGIAAKVARELR